MSEPVVLPEEDDDDDEEIEIEIPLWPDSAPEEVQRRFAIFQCLASAEIDINITVKACDTADKWILTGELPKEPKQKKPAHLSLAP